MANNRKSIHGQWTSRWTFILAATGAAVGLGNIWKFPYITGQNGGGAFVLVYLMCVIGIGIPLLIAEVLIGRHGRRNPATTLAIIAKESGGSKHWRIVGGLGILAGYLVLTYYSVIAGWSLDYIFQSLFGSFMYTTKVSVNTLFENLVANPLQMTLTHTVIMLSTMFVVGKGVQLGLERAVKYLFPVMIFLLFILLGYALDSGFFKEGFEFLFKPDFSKLTATGALIAMGHAFFTLSLANGSIIMYGAYLPEDASVAKAGFAIAAADTLIALLAGLVIFPIVFANGLEPAAGPGLIFKTLPLAFGHMPYGQFFSFLFFVMLVFAAFTSAISLLEPSVAWLMESKKMKRVPATLLTGSIIWVLGFGTIFSFNLWSEYKLFDLTFFELLDYLTANLMLPIGGFLTAIFTGWVMTKEKSMHELRTKDVHVFKLWRYSLKYLVPVAVVVIFADFVGLL